MLVGSATTSQRNESVIGTDERILVSDTTAFPWSAIVRVSVTFSDGSSGWGTGAMISPNDVLTAAHVLWDETTSGYVTSVTITPGLNGSSQPFGSYGGTGTHVSTTYQTTLSSEHDYGVVNLSSNVGDTTGYFDYSSAFANDLEDKTVNTAGYPADLSPTGVLMYSASDLVDFTFGNRLYYNGSLDTFSGQSGSPIWIYDTESDTRTLVGVHTTGGSSFNGGTQITAEIFADIAAWADDGTTSTGTTGTDSADSLVGSSAADTISGLGGSDTIVGGASGDLIFGNINVDLLSGGAGNDTIYGGQNDGTATLDAFGNLKMQDGTETIYGGSGNDLILGQYGNESIFGDAGADEIYGGQNSDTVSGGAGNDSVYGNRDADTVLGGDGDDLVFGGTGDDFLYGDNIASSTGSGWDTIDGGDGTDTAVYLNNFASYNLVRLGSDSISVNSFELLINVENIQFADQTISTDLIL
ncbi:MAG: trypsin-like serine protease [Rhodospirillaceae bacterium]|nr:trypsin-like serine protease [Rhodospirillaceae bacterium]MBT6136043.1 trypsin-like serine protease [Rhodospirillaceae bacterium]